MRKQEFVNCDGLGPLVTSAAMRRIAEKVEALLRKWNVHNAHGATANEIAGFEKKHRRKLTPAAKEFFRTVNGISLEVGLFRLFSLSDASEWIERWGTERLGIAWKYMPLGGPDEPDPFCVACGGPVKGMVFRVPHNDEAELMFRSIDSWLDWLLTVETREDWAEIWEKPPELSNSKRTAKDFAVASKLQAIEEFESEIDETDAHRFSMVLMSEAGLELFAKKLKAANMYTRQAAEFMLSNMKSLKAAEMLREYAAEMELFKLRCIDAIRAAEPDVEARPSSSRIRSGAPQAVVELRWKTKDVCMTFGAFYPDNPANLARLIDLARANLSIPADAISDFAMKLLEDKLHTHSASDSREVEAFLLQMPGERAPRILAAFREAVHAYGDRCVAYLREHGVEARLNSSEAAEYRPKIVLPTTAKVNELEVRSLYASRDDRDFWEQMLGRAKRLTVRS